MSEVILISFGKRAALVLSALALALPSYASAQYDADTSTSGSTTGQSRDTTSPNGQRAAGQQAARGAADAQIQAPTNERYRPDSIPNQSSNATAERPNEQRSEDQRTAFRPVSEFEAFVSKVVDKPLRRFGSNLLVPAARGFTAPPDTTVPLDYRVNPGDEVVVGLAGPVQTNDLRLVVDSEGHIFIPNVGSVNVGGIRYGDLQSVISRQVSRQYRNFRIAVSLGKLRGITVYVTGFAATPGSYTISSLSTLVNAVLAAGGPSAGGSFRSIQVRRHGRLISDFDLYDLLLKGDKSADVVLQNGDVVYITPVGAQVAVIGSVNSEAIFETRGSETLEAMLLYAGGISTVADDTRLLVLDALKTEGAGWEQLTPSEVRTRPAQRGLIVRVLSDLGIARPIAQQPVLVTINGEVTKPGRYYLQPGTTIADAVGRAGGLTSQAYPFASVFTRESVRAQQRQSFERALSELQFLLTAQPLVSATANAAIQPARIAAIQSVVGQLQDRKPLGRIVLDVGPTATQVPGELVLENNDELYVPPRPVTVGVFGLVPNPSSFQYSPTLTIGDYLAQAGGVQRIGDAKRVFVVRANGAVLPPSGKLLKTRTLPGDLVFVPIRASSGEFWARLGVLAQVLSSTALTAASVITVAR